MSTLTAEEVAELYWKCLETQSCHCPWILFKRIPHELQRVAPLERRIVYRSPEPGLRLMQAIRLYSPERAQELLSVLEFDMLKELSSGYSVAKRNFIKAVVRYQEYTLSLNYYGH